MSKSSAAYDNKGYENETAVDTVLQIEEKRRWDQKETLTYSWENLNVFAPVNQGCCNNNKKKIEDKHILKNVTGICRPGELLAVMGASGAGKTTLLNCLNFRSNPTLKIKGKLYVNGKRLTPDLLTSRSAYVQQEDIFIGTVTVREQLVFQANLRMDRSLSRQERMQRVDDVMMELNLVHCSDTLIGIPGVIKGISGGEMKRLAFACEVLTDPPIMFCDEPTTGLDSFMAQTIVEAMKNLASKGKTIISTIHQPSSEVFALFNRVLLMAEGRTAYLGSIDGALDFFAGLGRVCPENYNPADFFIGQLAIQPEKEEECKQFVTAACDAFESSTTGQEISRDAQNNSQGGKNGSANTNGEMKKAPSPYKVGWGSQFSAIFKRSTLENVRNVNVLRVKIVQALAIPLIIGLIYLDQTMDQKGVQNINGALFLVLTQISFSSTFMVINAFCADVPVFLREHFNGMYRVDSYFLAKNAAELPLNILLPAIFVSIYYYMVGFNASVERFFMHLLIIELVSNTVTSFGFMISCLARDENIATGLAPPLVVSLMLFGGLYMNSQTIPDYLIWLKYISWFSYSFEDLSINQWKGFGNVTCEGQANVGFCLNDGEEVLDSLGFKEENFGFNIGLLVVLMVSFRILAFLFLLKKTMRKTVKNYE